MNIIGRSDLRIGSVISYAHPKNGQILYGTIVHLGLGLATQQAVWVRCSGDHHTGNVHGILLKDVRGVITNAIR